MESTATAAEPYKNAKQYDVYSRELKPKASQCPNSANNASNNMPATPQQSAAAGQDAALSTSRVASTIPKGGSASTWTYPSPQMFWNALNRKGKVDGAHEEDMEVRSPRGRRRRRRPPPPPPPPTPRSPPLRPNPCAALRPISPH